MITRLKYDDIEAKQKLFLNQHIFYSNKVI